MLVLPVCLMVRNTQDGWQRFPGLFDPQYYLINLGLWFCLAFALFVNAFALRHKRGWPSVLMMLSSLCFIIASLDLLVLTTRAESSGPAGNMCISHRNWERRSVRANSAGFWEDEFPAKIEVAMVGDSFTWGQGIPDRRQRFSDLLSEKTGVKFWNYGRPGATTREETQDILPKIAASKPKVVVVCYLSNDIACDLQPYLPQVPNLEPWKRRLIQASPLYNYGYWRYFGRSGESEAGQRYFFTLLFNYCNQAAMAAHTQEIKTMVADIRRMGAKPVAVILPFPHMFMATRPEFRKSVYDSIRQAFEAEKTPVIELQSLEEKFPPGHFEVGPIDVHPSARVHAAIADGIADWFQAHPELLK